MSSTNRVYVFLVCCIYPHLHLMLHLYSMYVYVPPPMNVWQGSFCKALSPPCMCLASLSLPTDFPCAVSSYGNCVDACCVAFIVSIAIATPPGAVYHHLYEQAYLVTIAVQPCVKWSEVSVAAAATLYTALMISSSPGN